jgi:hypothetical protein
MARMKRPMVVEAYMTHSRTPFITERLVDGRIRKVARRQSGWEKELPELLTTYGDRWTGLRENCKPVLEVKSRRAAQPGRSNENEQRNGSTDEVL